MPEPIEPNQNMKILIAIAAAGILAVACMELLGGQTVQLTGEITSNVETNWVTEYTKTYPGGIRGWTFQAPVQHQHALIVSNVILNVQWQGRTIPVTVEKHDISPIPPLERDWTDPDYGLIKCNVRDELPRTPNRETTNDSNE